ncbi:MAG: hypothetical protein ACRDOO_26570, partial [Actinomadura sp.]
PAPVPPPGPPKSRTGLLVGLLVGAVVLVAAAVVAVVVVVNMTGGSGSGDATATVSRSSEPAPGRGAAPAGGLLPSDYDDDPSWRLWEPLNERPADSDPLTVAEVFDTADSRAATDSHGTRYTLQGTGQADSDCAQAVWGEPLRTALAAHGCTQVVRGVYADTGKRIVGHVAVFDLRDVTAADRFVKDLDPGLGKGFLTPLPGQAAPLDRFGSGYTGADAGAYGHFVVVSWVGFTDGADGAAAELDGIAPRSALQRAAKSFLFDRLAEAR